MHREPRRPTTAGPRTNGPQAAPAACGSVCPARLLRFALHGYSILPALAESLLPHNSGAQVAPPTATLSSFTLLMELKHPPLAGIVPLDFDQIPGTGMRLVQLTWLSRQR